MKKFLAILLAVMLLLTFAGCNRDTDTGVNNVTPAPEAFVKPENYVTVLKVTINPEFNLYLDKDGVVLAVEPVNADAKSVAQDITATGDIKTVMETIVTATNKGGFVKENAKVEIKVTEVKDTAVSPMEVLNTAKQTADDSFKKIDATVTVSSSVADGVTFITADPTPEPTQAPTQAPTQEPTKAPTPKPTPKPTPTPEPVYTTLEEKGGVWGTKYLANNTLYELNMKLVGKTEFGLSLGDPVNFDEMHPEEQKFCQEFNGKHYYFGRGSGDGLLPTVENGNDVTVSDLDGNKMVLKRTGENTLKVVSVDANFSEISNIPVGTILTYSAKTSE
ncbi:MAG: hypothetical protein E7365_06630 [Clostridiales bacterium]|nr:hypothetical protein [Clostridiales bacterium]